MVEMDPTPTEQVSGGDEQRKKLAKRLGDLVIDVRNRRRPFEETLLHNHAAWRSVRIEARAGYRSETYRHYIPVARRAIERIVTRVVQMLLPQSQFFEVYPGSEFDLAAGRQADAVRAYETYLLTQRIKIRKVITQLTRSLLIYQRAITKTTVTLMDAPVRWAGYAERVRQVWPTVRAVDPFSFYVWPETVTDMEDAVLVFEDLMLPWEEYQQAVTRKVAMPLNREDMSTPEWPHYHITRMAHLGMSDPTATRGAQADELDKPKAPVSRPQLFVSLTEAWFKSEGRWMMAWLVWNASKDNEGSPMLVRIQKAPYPQPPYREALARPLPGEHYTTGAMDDLEQLQQLFNDQINQGEESRAIASLPPTGVDTNVFPRKDLLVWKPRGVWVGQGDMSKAMKAMELPDTSASSVRAAQLTLALINSIGGAGGIQEGQPARGLPRAGFAVTSLINLGMADVKDVAEIIEQELLTPMLSDLHRLTVAFVPRPQLIRIPGAGDDYPPRALTVSDLYGDWAFKWVGSQQAATNEIRSQKLMAGAQMLAKVDPMLRPLGYMVNWPDLVKMIWRDGLGERGLSNIIVPVPVAPGGVAQGTEQQGAAQGSPTGEEGLDRMIAGLLGGQGG